ncbi:hypothetical protein U1Q18_001870 [Sarracenia purpurea var. burkii]
MNHFMFNKMRSGTQPQAQGVAPQGSQVPASHTLATSVAAPFAVHVSAPMAPIPPAAHVHPASSALAPATVIPAAEVQKLAAQVQPPAAPVPAASPPAAQAATTSIPTAEIAKQRCGDGGSEMRQWRIQRIGVGSSRTRSTHHDEPEARIDGGDGGFAASTNLRWWRMATPGKDGDAGEGRRR